MDHIIVVDCAYAKREGWKECVLIALHEYAHLLREDLARGSYPHLAKLDEVDVYLLQKEQHLRRDAPRNSEELGQVSGLRSAFSAIGNAASDQLTLLFGDDGTSESPLGSWATRTNQGDGAHDLLFYLLLYVLERQADDRGYLAGISQIRSSAYAPESIPRRGRSAR